MSNSVLLQGDCLEMLKQLPDNSVDSLITDPPAGISFMGLEFDSDKGGRKQWISWMSEVMTECLRVMKPGAHGLVWALPRTSHWTGTALEDAGFQIRDTLHHAFGSGFPKSMDISKAIDKAAGAEREVVGVKPGHEQFANRKTKGHLSQMWERPSIQADDYSDKKSALTAPSTPEAKQWQGWGTALKPAHEVWWLIRKPCSEDTVAANVLLHGIGGINIDQSRIKPSGASTGRFPSNLLFSHNHDCVEVGVKKVKAIQGGSRGAGGQNGAYSNIPAQPDFKPGVGDEDGTETVSAFECTDGCPVAELDKQSAGPKGDSGASRFFYVAKASKRDKGEGNTHPTPKNTSLMSYLIKMITPPGGIVLDCFMGSGSTGVSAIKNGFAFIGIEKEAEYYTISEKRIQGATNGTTDSSNDDSAA